ncbi:MAG: secondary thiamine-phosphate synthase enzyme YjbQ [Candidatus Diapherotrites archaeon]
MQIYSSFISFESKKENHLIDLTEKVEKELKQSKLKEGIVFLFAVGSTCALTTIEFEPGLQKDFPEFLDKIIPRGKYHHDLTWHDGNGHSHVRASLLKPDLFIPFSKGKLLTGTWQQIAFIELDNKPRTRKVEIKILGE